MLLQITMIGLGGAIGYRYMSLIARKHEKRAIGLFIIMLIIGMLAYQSFIEWLTIVVGIISFVSFLTLLLHTLMLKMKDTQQQNNRKVVRYCMAPIVFEVAGLVYEITGIESGRLDSNPFHIILVILMALSVLKIMVYIENYKLNTYT